MASRLVFVLEITEAVLIRLCNQWLNFFIKFLLTVRGFKCREVPRVIAGGKHVLSVHRDEGTVLRVGIRRGFWLLLRHEIHRS